MSDMTRNAPRTVGALLVAALALGACETPPETVTDLTANEPVLKVVMATSGEAKFPSGSAELSETVISGFDFTVPDGFARGNDPGEDFYPVDNPFGAANAYDMGGNVRNSSQDTRLPTLSESDAAVGDFFAMFNPGFTGNGPNAHDLFGELVGLAPNTTYSVVLAQMWLQVNGELDQNQILTGRTVTAPDELMFTGGTPTGYPGIVCNFSAFSDVSDLTNPVMLGTVTTDADGNVTVDCVVRSVGNSPWWADDSTQSPDAVTDPDQAPFGDNRASASLLPGQFNYLMLYEGVGTATDPVPTENPTVRIQVGPDIDQNLNVINNGMKPLPTAVADDPASLPGGAESFPAPGKIELDLTGLATLGGMQYTLWAYDRASGSYTLAEGSEITIDEGAPITGASFDSPGPDAQIHVDLTPGADFGATTHVVMSMEAGAAGTPSESRFLFKEYLTSGLALSGGAMTFGGFNGGTGDYQFLNGGSGTGEFIVVNGVRRLNADLRRVPKPAQGFRYTSYLVELQPATPVTQFQRANEVQLDNLGNGKDVITENQVSPSFAGYNTYVLLLEPAGAQILTPHFVQVSDNYQFKFVEFFPR